MLEWLALILLIPLVLFPVVLLFGFAGCSLLVGGDGGDGDGDGDDEIVFEKTFEVPLTGEQKRPDRTIVVRIEPGPHLSKSGNQVRLTIQGPTDGELTIKQLYISQAADTPDSDLYDAAEDLTHVASGISPTGSQNLDAVKYSLDHTKPLLLAFDIGQSGDVPELSDVSDKLATSFVGPKQNPPLHEAAMDDRQSGYDVENRIYLVNRIEVSSTE